MSQPPVNSVHRHVAVIMDGNGRWAKERHLPRLAGHNAGAKAVERTLKAAQKASEITEDDLKRYETDVQKATDANIAKIDQVIKNKEAEIMMI